MGQSLQNFSYKQRPGSLAADVLARISVFGRTVSYGTGDRIHERGDTDVRLSIVAAGNVRLSNTDADGRRLEMTMLRTGDFFGVHQMLSLSPYSHDAHAEGATHVLSFDRSAVSHLLDTDSVFRDHLLLYLADRLVLALQALESERRYPLQVRVAQYLLSRRQDESGEVLGSQEQHAQALGVSRYALGNSLQQLASEGLLTIGRKSVAIASHSLLEGWLERQTNPT